MEFAVSSGHHEDQLVKVAITPHGNADSAVRSRLDELMYFVKPLEEDEPFCDFIEYVQKQEQEVDNVADVKYAQTQNDNLRGEYSDLFQDVEEDIAWARIALGRKPEAINLWIGNSWSTTALHRDNYENIYCQVMGSKHFVLLPPVEFACINEWKLRSARYRRSTGDAHVQSITENNGRSGLLIVPDGIEEETVPLALWDPDSPEEHSTEFSHLSKPMRISLAPGDMLYLPALWYHKVSQTCNAEGLCCAVNYWYDMDFDGHMYSSSSFIRNATLSATGVPED